MSEEQKLDAIFYVPRDTKGLIAIARHLAGAHPRILLVSAAPSGGWVAKRMR